MMMILLTLSSPQVAVLKKLQGREHVCRFIGCGRNDRCQRQRHRQHHPCHHHHHPCHHHHHQHHLHHNQLNHPHDAQVQLRGNAAAGKELGRTAKSATKGRFQSFHHTQVDLYLCLRICICICVCVFAFQVIDGSINHTKRAFSVVPLSSGRRCSRQYFFGVFQQYLHFCRRHYLRQDKSILCLK